MFTADYHELNNLIRGLGNVDNFQTLVKETSQDLIFLHQLQARGARYSYGIELARLSGSPKP